MPTLPYRIETATGDVLDITFPLHSETVDPVRVDQMLSAILDAIDKDIKVCGETGNGDVIQALAMALAVRARMIHAPEDVTATLAKVLLEKATNAASAAERTGPEAGTA